MQEQERLPVLVEMGRVPSYAPPVYHPADQEPEEGKLPLSQYLWILKRWSTGRNTESDCTSLICVAKY